MESSRVAHEHVHRNFDVSDLRILVFPVGIHVRMCGNHCANVFIVIVA